MESSNLIICVHQYTLNRDCKLVVTENPDTFTATEFVNVLAHEQHWVVEANNHVVEGTPTAMHVDRFLTDTTAFQKHLHDFYKSMDAIDRHYAELDKIFDFTI